VLFYLNISDDMAIEIYNTGISGLLPQTTGALHKMEKILFVDDETSVLEAMKRTFHKKFDLQVASSAEHGLSLMQANGNFAVLVSDYQMPGCDGISFLSQAAKISPDSVRIMLTGLAQFETSIRAVNEGHVFRFLAKPCPTDVLERALKDAILQYRLIRSERELSALMKWNEGLGGMIQAFVRLIEAKDPYTSGHQIRVAHFAVAIAQSMNLSSDLIEQVRLAAMIHDIGKIYVPVEFLNKPGKLNPSEWNIIQMHAQIGHDILSPIGFSFPLHIIVLQHHERIDGSGYPLGIKGPEILMQAKIIAVADVVEAIAHHRPYRPAKGMNEAIIELKTNSGTKYDEQVVSTALALLTEKAYTFNEQ
jgi:putative two-component system response regulator